MARILLALIATFAAGACAVPRVAAPTVSDATAAARAAIDEAWRTHIDAAVRKDVDGVLAMYHEDMLYIVPPDTEVRGLDALRAMEAATLEANDVLHAVHVVDHFALYGDVAYELGTVTGPVRPRGGEPEVFTFHFMAQWVRGPDGAWRLRYMIGQP